MPKSKQQANTKCDIPDSQLKSLARVLLPIMREYLSSEQGQKDFTVKSGFTHFQDNDVAFAKITPCFQNRKSVVFINLQNGYGAGTTELHILRAYAGTIIPDYLLWYVKSPYFIEWGKQHFSGTAGQQRFGTEEVKKTLIPIPPLEEQKQIVNKIHQILNSIEKDEV